MFGNVWEWCSDIYDETVYGSYRIFRGGGWADEERSVMSTTRRRSHPLKFKIDDLGFRIAKNKTEKMTNHNSHFKMKSNKEIVSDFINATNQKDWDKVLTLVHNDFVLDIVHLNQRR
jgi:hypothetical protein